MEDNTNEKLYIHHRIKINHMHLSNDEKMILNPQHKIYFITHPRVYNTRRGTGEPFGKGFIFFN